MKIGIALLKHLIERREVGIDEDEGRRLVLRSSVRGRRRCRCERDAYGRCPFVTLTHDGQLGCGDVTLDNNNHDSHYPRPHGCRSYIGEIGPEALLDKYDQ